ncbi:hypothetical protein C3492_13925 [Streptomyces sp. Ru62]|nr:hypothetical protein C3492_13925 [Streptomyces sp. Ru62]
MRPGCAFARAPAADEKGIAVAVRVSTLRRLRRGEPHDGPGVMPWTGATPDPRVAEADPP